MGFEGLEQVDGGSWVALGAWAGRMEGWMARPGRCGLRGFGVEAVTALQGLLRRARLCLGRSDWLHALAVGYNWGLSAHMRRLFMGGRGHEELAAGVEDYPAPTGQVAVGPEREPCHMA